MKKKILIGFCIFLAVLIIGGYIFMRTAFFAERVRLIVKSTLEKQLGREVSVGKITGNIFRGINVDGITIARNEKISDGKLVEVEKVLVDYSLLSLLRWRFVIKNIGVGQPRIWLELDEEGQLNLPKLAATGDKGKKSRFSVLVSNLDIFSGQVMFDDRKNSIHSVANEINGNIKGTGGQMDYSGKIGIREIEVDFQGVSKTISDLTCSFETSEVGVKLSDFRLQSGKSELQANGEILAGDLPRVSMEVRSRLFLEDVSGFLITQATRKQPLHRLDGMADIYGVVVGEMSNPSGMCKIQLPNMRVNDLDIQNVDLEAKFTLKSLSLTHLSANLAEGLTNLKGEVQLADGKVSNYNSIIKLDHLDIDGIISKIGGSEAPISGYLSGELSVSGTGLHPGDVNARGRFSILDTGYWMLKHQASGVRPPASEIKASLDVEDGSIALNLSQNETSVELRGKLSDEGELDLSLDLEGLDLGEITSLSTGSPSIIGKGRITTETSMKIVHPGFRTIMGLPPADSPAGLIEGIADLRAQVNVDVPDLRLPVRAKSPLTPLYKRGEDEDLLYEGGEQEHPIQEGEEQEHTSSKVGTETKVDSRQEKVVSDVKPQISILDTIHLGSLTGTINLIDDRLLVDEILLQKGESKCRVTAQSRIKDLLETRDASRVTGNARLTIDSLRIEDYLPSKELPLSGGLVNGELEVRGEIMNGDEIPIPLLLKLFSKKLDLQGSGRISVTGLSVADRDIDQISVPIEIESSILKIPNLVVSGLGEQITAVCSVNPSGDYNLQVDSSSIDLSKMTADDLPISGTMQISLSGSGNVSSPMLKGKLDLRNLGYNGENFGDGECIFDLGNEKAHVDVSLSDRALVATLDSGIKDPFPFKAIVQLGNINLEPALKMAGLSERMGLHITGTIDIDGKGADPTGLSMDAVLQTLALDVEGNRWANEYPVRFGFDSGKLWIHSLDMKSAVGQLAVNGEFDAAENIDLNVNVEGLNLAVIPELLNLPERVMGKLDCAVRVSGNVASPAMEMELNVSGIVYDQVEADSVSGLISYENGTIEVKNLTLNAFGADAAIKVLLPLDLDLRNPPTPEQIMGKSIYASVDVENLNLSFMQPFIPQLTSAYGEIDDAHLEITGPLTQPKMNGLLKLKDANLQLQSPSISIENLDGMLSIQSTEPNGDLSRDIGYKATLDMGWKIEEGTYKAQGSIRIPRSFVYSMMDSSYDARAAQPDFQLDLKVQNGQLGSLIAEMAADQSGFWKKPEQNGETAASAPEASSPFPPIDGNLSLEVHLDGSLAEKQTAGNREIYAIPIPGIPAVIDVLRGYIVINALNLSLDDRGVKIHGPISVSLTDQELAVSSSHLLTPTAGTGLPGTVTMSGKVSADKKLEFDLSGEHLSPGLFSFLMNPSTPMSGDLDFRVNANGRLDSPTMEFSLTGKDLDLPVSSADGNMRIDGILCRMSYGDETFNLEEFHVDSFGNRLDASGMLPVSLSLMPLAAVLPDREMSLKLVAHNFNLAFLSHLAGEIEEVRGNVETDVRILGSIKDPRLIGHVQLLDASCRLMIDRSKLIQANITGSAGEMPATPADESSNVSVAQPMDIENVNLDVSMDGGAITGKMGFGIGGGQYEAQGRVEIGRGLKPQLFNLTFNASPAKIDPFLHLADEKLASSVSGEITIDGHLEGDARELRGKPILDTLKMISGGIRIASEGIKIDAAGHEITNPGQIYAEFQNGNLDLRSLRLIDKKPGSERSSSISAFGGWQIDGEKSFDATIDLDMNLVSELMSQNQPKFMNGWLTFKIQARGEEVRCFWPPASVSADQGFTVGHATIDRFEGNIIYRDHEIQVEQIHISSDKNHIFFSGSVPITGREMALQLDARLDDMSILSFLSKDITESKGRGTVDVTITGNMEKVIAREEPVRFVGVCRFDDLDVNFDRAYMKFEDIKADIEFDSQSSGLNRGFITLKAFQGKMNSGEFFLNAEPSAQSGAGIMWSKEANFRIGVLRNISIAMKDCVLYDPMVYSIQFDGELSLKGRFDDPILTGSVTVGKGEYVESMENLVQRLLSTREIGVKAFLDYPLVQDLELDVNVRTPNNIRVKNDIVDTEAKVVAKVRGSLADPEVLAQANIVEGKIFYFGPEFDIIKGSIRNESKINPKYDITAQMEIAKAGDVIANTDESSTQKVQMELKGSLNEFQPPRFSILGGGVEQQRYNMSAEEIIVILTLGGTPEEFLSKGAKWYLENRAAKRLKLKEFQMQIDLNDYKETRVVMAKQLMDQISVLADVGYRGQQWIGLQYEVIKHFALAGEVSQDGDWGFDLKIKRDFP